MAIVEKTGGAINKLFIQIPQKSYLFAYNSESGSYDLLKDNEAKNSIVFIEDSREIWAQDKFYGFSTDNERDLASILAGLGSEIKSTKDVVKSITAITGTGNKAGEHEIEIVKGINVNYDDVELTYTFTYSYGYFGVETVQTGNNVSVVEEGQSPTTITSIVTGAPTISIVKEGDKEIIKITSSYSYDINDTNIAASAKSYINGNTVAEQLTYLSKQIVSIEAVQAGGLPFDDDHIDSYSIATTNSYIFNGITIDKYGNLSYTESKLTAADITYIAAAENIPEVTVAAALEQLNSKIDNARDNYLAEVHRVYNTTATTPTSGSSRPDTISDNKDGSYEYLFIEFVIKSRSAKTDDDSGEGAETPNTVQYIYVAAQDLLNNYQGGAYTGYSNAEVQVDTNVHVDGTNIYTYTTTTVHEIAASKITSLTPASDGGYISSFGDNVDTAITNLNTGIQNAYTDLYNQIQSLDAETVKNISGSDNISVSYSSGSYTVSAYFTYDFTDDPGYVKSGVAQTYTDIVGYLNAGIADAHGDAIDTATNNAYTSIATYMMWHTVGETTETSNP